MIIQENDSFLITSKHLSLAVKLNEFVVTSLLGQPYRLPLVILCNNKIWKPIDIFCDKNILTAGINKELKISSIDESIITLEISNNGPITVMWPSEHIDCYFADDMTPIDQKFTNRCVYNMNNSDPTSSIINIPVLSQVRNGCLSTTFLGKSAEICVFSHETKQYANITSQNKFSLHFRSLRSRSESLKYIYQTYPQTNKIAHQNETLNNQQMQELLHFNGQIKNDSPDVLSQIIEKTQNITGILDKANIANCIVGTLAMRLNGFLCHVKDVDIIVDSVREAKETLKKEDMQIEVSSDNKWKECSFRILNHIPQIDIAEVSQISHQHCESIVGLNVLNKEGLLFMKLIGEYERNQMEPGYKQMKTKNHRDIHLLLKEAPYVYPFFHSFLYKNNVEQFKELMSIMEEAQWNDTYVESSFPTIVNMYKTRKNLLIPVINLGSPCKTKVNVGTELSNVKWKGLETKGEPTIIYKSSKITEIIIPEVRKMGILICEEK